MNTARNLINRILNISDRRFHDKNKGILRNILIDNSFPIPLIDRLIRQNTIPQRHNRHNNVITTEPKIYKSLTYIPEISEKFEKCNIFDRGKYIMVHKSYKTLDTLFSKIKD